MDNVGSLMLLTLGIAAMLLGIICVITIVYNLWVYHRKGLLFWLGFLLMCNIIARLIILQHTYNLGK